MRRFCLITRNCQNCGELHKKSVYATMMCQSNEHRKLTQTFSFFRFSGIVDLLARCQKVGSGVRHWTRDPPRHVDVLAHQRLRLPFALDARRNHLIQNLQNDYVGRAEDIRGTSIQVSVNGNVSLYKIPYLFEFYLV